MNNERKLFSVVTICRNEENNIEKTLKSILNQNSMNYEYVIIDGDSTDGTKKIIENYLEQFNKKDIKVTFISEKDSGIYDAMNKSLNYISGRWTIFINGGDEFIDDEILVKVENVIFDEIDVLYGDVVLFDNGHYKYLPAGEINEITYKNPICHQSVFTRTEILKEYRFDTNYRIVSDYDLFLRLYLNKKNFKKENFPISIFDFTGFSLVNMVKCQKEMVISQKKQGIKSKYPSFVKILYSFFIENARKIMILIFGNVFFSNKRKWFQSIDEMKL